MDKSVLNHIESIFSWGWVWESIFYHSLKTRPQSVSAAGVRLEGHRLGAEFIGVLPVIGLETKPKIITENPTVFPINSWFADDHRVFLAHNFYHELWFVHFFGDWVIEWVTNWLVDWFYFIDKVDVMGTPIWPDQNNSPIGNAWRCWFWGPWWRRKTAIHRRVNG